MDFSYILALGLFCLILHAYTWTQLRTYTDVAFRRFQSTYLVVYGLAVGADWLQGPYVYALYEKYGIEKHDIELLFVVGFASSLFFGTFVGGLADRTGRRSNCVLYALFYSASCITKHFNNFPVLLFGRVLAGIATSILYSAFESWLVCEHARRGYTTDQLSATFTYASLLNSIVAVSSGLLAQCAVDLSGGWYVAAFDVALLVLIAMSISVLATWSENYGDSETLLCTSFVRALTSMRSDLRIPLLATMQSVFEGAMYIFVLEWTPALERAADSTSPSEGKVHFEANENGINTPHKAATIRHGLVFMAFMICTMIGAALFRLVNRFAMPETYMILVLAVASFSFLPVLITPNLPIIVFAGFCLFETCVGVFWPSFGILRFKYIPEETRATLMNFFRVPLNLIVIIVLLQDLPVYSLFLCCTVLLGVAALLQLFFYLLTRRASPDFKSPSTTARVENSV